MLSLSAKSRKIVGKKVKALRKEGVLPAVLYGPKIKKSLSLEVDLKEFEKIYREAGESSLISLKTEGEKEYLVLVHAVDRDPLTEKLIHVDFYQPRLEEEVEVTVPLVFEGEAPVLKEQGGTLVKYISEVTVKALPQDLPKEIIVNIGNLRTFEDNILVRDLPLPPRVKILRGLDEIVASVSSPEKVEKELAEPVEEKVEEVEKVEEEKKPIPTEDQASKEETEKKEK